ARRAIPPPSARGRARPGPARRASARAGRGPSRSGRCWRGRRGGRRSRLLPRRFPGADAVAEILPLAGRALVQRPSEAGAHRRLEMAADRVLEVTGHLLGREPPIALQPPRRLRMREHRVAVAEGVEDLPIDVGGPVAREEDDEWRHVVGIALGADRLLARPLAGAL